MKLKIEKLSILVCFVLYICQTSYSPQPIGVLDYQSVNIILPVGYFPVNSYIHRGLCWGEIGIVLCHFLWWGTNHVFHRYLSRFVLSFYWWHHRPILRSEWNKVLKLIQHLLNEGERMMWRIMQIEENVSTSADNRLSEILHIIQKLSNGNDEMNHVLKCMLTQRSETVHDLLSRTKLFLFFFKVITVFIQLNATLEYMAPSIKCRRWKQNYQ